MQSRSTHPCCTAEVGERKGTIKLIVKRCPIVYARTVDSGERHDHGKLAPNVAGNRPAAPMVSEERNMNRWVRLTVRLGRSSTHERLAHKNS